MKPLKLLRLLSVSLALGALLTPAHAQNSSTEKIRLMSSALRAHDAGQLDVAKTNADQLLKIAPDDPSVLRLVEAINKDLAAQGQPTIAMSGGGAAPAMAAAPRAPAPTIAPSPAAAPAAAPIAGPRGGNAARKMSLMSAAVQAKNAGDLATAKGKLDQILAIDPNDAAARRMMAELSGAPAPAVAAAPAPAGRTTFGGPAPAPRPMAAPAGARPAPVGAAPRAMAAAPSGSTSSLLQSEAMRQRETIEAAWQDVAAARRHADRGHFRKALEFLTGTQRNLPVNTATVGVIEDIQSEKIYVAAELFEQTRKSGDAAIVRELLSEYKDLFGETPRYKDLNGEVEGILRNPYNQNIREISYEWSEQQDKIADMIVQARSRYLFGDMQGAQQILKDVEARDPDNIEAKALQIRISRDLNSLGELDRHKTTAQMIEGVNRSWQLPQIFDIKQTKKPTAVEDPPALLKLRAIKIPRVQYSGMPLQEVIKDLSEESVEWDRSTDDPENKGVNIVMLENDENPPVSITLRNFTMERIVDYITKSVEFQYYIEEDTVVIVKGGKGDTMETRFYPLPRATFIRITGKGAGDGGGGGGPSNPFEDAGGGVGAGGGSDRSADSEELKAFFTRAGVPFANGADLAYDNAQIIVTNTSRYLDRLEVILRKYDETKQVEIEAKFLEVRQGVLEELGFNWNITRIDANDFSRNRFFATQFDSTAANSSTGATTGSLTDLGVASGANLRTLANQFATSGDTVGNGQVISGGVTTVVENSPPSLPNVINLASGALAQNFAWGTIFNEWDAQMTIRALEQKTGSDLMTAPRITVLAGKPASIIVAQRIWYPTSYGDVEAEVSTGDTGGDAVAITPGTPQDFETENIGVVLDVTPEVEEDNNITLKLNPRVTEFEGFVEYGGRAVAVTTTTTATVPTGFFMPVFSVRELSTEVTIFDGATVVLGGLTREEVKTVKDSVPILGDIPLMGRLFRSEGETRQKRNLLIFVSANLISPGGSPSKQDLTSVQANSLFQNPVIVTPGGAVGRKVTEVPPEQ